MSLRAARSQRILGPLGKGLLHLGRRGEIAGIGLSQALLDLIDLPGLDFDKVIDRPNR
jgi:hypothetical protein